MRANLLPFLFLGLVSCTGNEVFLRVDDSFTACERQDIEEAARMWRDFAGVTVRVEYTSVAEANVIRSGPWYPDLAPPSRLGAFVHDDKRVYLANDRLSGKGPGARTSTMAHELGHWLGLGHSTDPNAVMCSEDSEAGSCNYPSTRFSDGDLSLCDDAGLTCVK